MAKANLPGGCLVAGNYAAILLPCVQGDVAKDVTVGGFVEAPEAALSEVLADAGSIGYGQWL